MKVEKVESGCWKWTSAIAGNGYGVFWIGGGKSDYAHRLAFARATGVEPVGVVMHKCNNKWCVNPDHLQLGSQKENVHMAMADGLRAIGERNGGGGKLKETDVQVILREREVGCVRMARRFGVSSSTIKSIRRRSIWKHVAA